MDGSVARATHARQVQVAGHEVQGAVEVEDDLRHHDYDGVEFGLPVEFLHKVEEYVQGAALEFGEFVPVIIVKLVAYARYDG